MTLHPRSEVFGPALPTNANGSLRPIMAPGARWFTVHHTGAGRYGDPGDTPAEMRAIQSAAVAAGKGWEYNFVVDTDGEAWTYAGEYVAAHSAGENATAIGVLLLVNAEIEPVTDAMVDGVRWLRAQLVASGRLAADHQMLQHRQMPGAATACPGRNAIARWADLTAPWQPPTPIPTPEDDPVQILYRDKRWANVFLIGASPAQQVSGKTMEALVAAGVPFVVDQHDQALECYLFQSGLTASDLVPA